MESVSLCLVRDGVQGLTAMPVCAACIEGRRPSQAAWARLSTAQGAFQRGAAGRCAGGGPRGLGRCAGGGVWSGAGTGAAAAGHGCPFTRSPLSDIFMAVLAPTPFTLRTRSAQSEKGACARALMIFWLVAGPMPLMATRSAAGALLASTMAWAVVALRSADSVQASTRENAPAPL